VEGETMTNPVVTRNGVAVSEAAIAQFAGAMHGALLRPDSGDYDEARKVWNRLVDKRPALICRCADADDVARSLRFAREHDLLVAVRGGGHNIAGNCVCEGGLMVDLSPMKGIRVDAGRRTAWAEPGLRLGEFDRATQAHGLATTMGVASDTGIAGLTLGGGYGWLGGRHGLACDNLLSVELVTADGQHVTASESQNADLFWGVRGGGGNFGVVTSFEYRLHPVRNVLGGMALYAPTAQVVRFFDEFSSTCPDEVSTAGLLTSAPDGSLVFAIAACHCGSIEEAERRLRRCAASVRRSRTCSSRRITCRCKASQTRPGDLATSTTGSRAWSAHSSTRLSRFSSNTPRESPRRSL
jgi:FAD/FMN-containing dehydrogenase